MGRFLDVVWYDLSVKYTTGMATYPLISFVKNRQLEVGGYHSVGVPRVATTPRLRALYLGRGANW